MLSTLITTVGTVARRMRADWLIVGAAFTTVILATVLLASGPIYADAVTMWDVVNEAISDGDDGLLRDSVYSRATGIDFIVTAFKAARANALHSQKIGHLPEALELRAQRHDRLGAFHADAGQLGQLLGRRQIEDDLAFGGDAGRRPTG